MYLHKNKGEGGRCGIVDPWEAFRGKYPDPTPEEYNLVLPYLHRFAWEVDDFDESRAWWVALKNRLKSPNLRYLLIKFLQQVRGSKGYDVDTYFDFITHPHTVFVPRSLDDKKSYEEAMVATKFTIGEINTSMESAGKSYELVSVEKLVSSKSFNFVKSPTVNNMLLLTFTAKKIIAAAVVDANTNANAIAFQAMVLVCDQPPFFQLKEWKFKTIPIA